MDPFYAAALASYNKWMDQYGDCRTRYNSETLSIIEEGYINGYTGGTQISCRCPDLNWYYNWAYGRGEEHVRRNT